MNILTTVWKWETQRVVRNSPGVYGVLALIVFPLLYLAPWQRLGLFSSSFEASLVITALYVFMIASNIGMGSGEFGNTAFWLYQKGVFLSDYALARLLVCYVWGFAFAAYALLLGVTAMGLYGDIGGRQVLVLGGVLVFLLLLVQAVYYLLGAFRLGRRSEIMVLLVILAFAQDLLLRTKPRLVQKLVHFMLPPLEDAFAIVPQATNSDWQSALASFMHIGCFLLACVLMASLAHRRWRPAQSGS